MRSLCSSIYEWAEIGENVTRQTPGRRVFCCSTATMEASAGALLLRCTSPTSPNLGEERRGEELGKLMANPCRLSTVMAVMIDCG